MDTNNTNFKILLIPSLVGVFASIGLIATLSLPGIMRKEIESQSPAINTELKDQIKGIRFVLLSYQWNVDSNSYQLRVNIAGKGVQPSPEEVENALTESLKISSKLRVYTLFNKPSIIINWK